MTMMATMWKTSNPALMRTFLLRVGNDLFSGKIRDELYPERLRIAFPLPDPWNIRQNGLRVLEDDEFFGLSVISIALPALRERDEDIDELPEDGVEQRDLIEKALRRTGWNQSAEFVDQFR